jgi:hypothetical protein
MMKRIYLFNILFITLAMLCGLSSPGMAAGVTAHFSWLPNQEDSVTGYRLYYATSSGNYDADHSIAIDNPQLQDGRIYGEVPDLTEGTTYYFVVTAHDDQGTESEYSEEIQWTATAPTTPKPPTPRVISVRTIN